VPRHPRVFRFSDVGWRLLRQLAGTWGTDNTAALVRAIDEAHTDEITPETPLRWHEAKMNRAFRLPRLTLMQLNELRQHWGTSATETVTLALHKAAERPAERNEPSPAPRSTLESAPPSAGRPDESQDDARQH